MSVFYIIGGLKWLLHRVCVQETSMSTPTKEPPTLSSTSLGVGVLMRGARRWWRRTGVRSVSQEARARIPSWFKVAMLLRKGNEVLIRRASPAPV